MSMMNVHFVIKQGDNQPELIETLSELEASYPDLTGCEVRLIIRLAGDSPKVIVKTAVVEDAALYEVRYAFSSEETASTGIYLYEWEVEYPDGKKITVPQDGFRVMHVVPDLDRVVIQSPLY